MIEINKLSFSYTKTPFIQDMSFSVGSAWNICPALLTSALLMALFLRSFKKRTL